MDAGIGHSVQLYRVLNWLEENWRRAAVITCGIIVVGIVVAYFLWQGKEQERKASHALSGLLARGDTVSAEALLQVADAQAGTQAGSRALLLAAGRLFADGKHAEAQAQFEKFLQSDPEPSLTAEARLGLAACKEALGDTQAAVAGYKAIADNPASGNVLPQARFALARLYSAQGEIELARSQYELLAAERGSSLASEAMARLNELPAAEPAISGGAATGGVTATNLIPTNEL